MAAAISSDIGAGKGIYVTTNVLARPAPAYRGHRSMGATWRVKGRRGINAIWADMSNRTVSDIVVWYDMVSASLLFPATPGIGRLSCAQAAARTDGVERAITGG
jgi:hypothetical protein